MSEFGPTCTTAGKLVSVVATLLKFKRGIFTADISKYNWVPPVVASEVNDTC